MITSLPDYDGKKAAAELFSWNLCGWRADPRPVDETVLLSRWEDKNGNPIPAPPTEVRKCGGTFYVCKDGEHQAFLRLPYYDTGEVWLLLLRIEELRKRRTG